MVSEQFLKATKFIDKLNFTGVYLLFTHLKSLEERDLIHSIREECSLIVEKP